LISACAEGVSAGWCGALLHTKVPGEVKDELPLARWKPALFDGWLRDLHREARALQEALLFARRAEPFS